MIENTIEVKPEQPMLRDPDEWAKQKGSNPHLYAGARRKYHWVIGDQITEADFDAKMEAFAGSAF